MAVAPLQLPGYQSAPDLNWQSLDQLGKTLGDNRLNNQRREAMSLATLGQDGSANYKATINRLVGLGDLEGAGQVAGIQKAIAPESSADLQAYNLYSKQEEAAGRKPMPFLPFKTKLAEAAASKTTVNNSVNTGERAYDQAMGKELADLNVGIIKGASSARNTQANIDRLDQLLSDPSVYQGTGGEKVLQAKRLAKSMGFDVGDVGGAEAVQAISNHLALQARNPAGGAGMPGAMSDSDREYLKAMQPGLEKTPEGNKQIIDVSRKLNQRAIDVEKFRQGYIREHGRLNEGFYAALNDWSEKTPMFPKQQRSPASQRGQAQPTLNDIDAELKRRGLR